MPFPVNRILGFAFVGRNHVLSNWKFHLIGSADHSVFLLLWLQFEFRFFNARSLRDCVLRVGVPPALCEQTTNVSFWGTWNDQVEELGQDWSRMDFGYSPQVVGLLHQDCATGPPWHLAGGLFVSGGREVALPWFIVNVQPGMISYFQVPFCLPKRYSTFSFEWYMEHGYKSIDRIENIIRRWTQRIIRNTTVSNSKE